MKLKQSLVRIIGLLLCTIVNTTLYTLLTLLGITKIFVIIFTIIGCCVSFIILVYKIEPFFKNRFRIIK